MKKLLTITLFLGVIGLNAQTVRFSYDECGNRTARFVEGKNDLKSDFLNFVQDQNPGRSVEILPNPSNGPVAISLGNEEMLSNGMIELYSSNGALLAEWKMTESRVQIDLSPFEDGVYVLKVSTGQAQLIEKLIKY